ncbi:Auxin-induced protein AUX22 [Bienertia sinuspersici]
MSKARFEHEITELRLGLPGGTITNKPKQTSCDEGDMKNEKKRVYSDIGNNDNGGVHPTAKAAVGWPPVCSYRRRSIGSEKECIEASKKLVKISMDGVPFLRKIDVTCYQEYPELIAAVETLFGCSGIKEALEDADNSEYIPIYEDKDGDWLLAGDVPWNMFIESCKRLRIMKRADAKGFGLQSKKHCHG